MEERREISWGEKIRLLKAGLIPLAIIFSMTGLFLMGVTSLVECSAAGAAATTLAALLKRRLTWRVLQDTPEDHPERQLHVYVGGHPGGPLFRRRL